MSGINCLAGRWSLRPKGSDYLPELDEEDGVPAISKIIDVDSIFEITQVSDVYDEVHMTDKAGTPDAETVYLHLGKLNFESVTSKSVLVSIVVHVDRDFKELSILRIGPNKHQRSLVQYKLDHTGAVIRVEMDLVLGDNTKKKLVKYLNRQVGSQQPEPKYLHSSVACSNWVHVNNHSSKSFRSLKMKIPRCEEIVTPVSSGTKRAPTQGVRMPSLADAEAGRLEPHVTRHFSGNLSEGEQLTVFAIELSHGNEDVWTVWHRYREFEALKKLIECEMSGHPEMLSELPPFPGKTIGRVKGKALDTRREALEAYIWALIINRGFNNMNVIDALCSFLEIPEHTIVEAEVPSAQNLLRQQIISPGSGHAGEHSNTAAAMESKEVFPKHILLNKLMRGIRILKHGRHGAPRLRLLRCNPTLTRLYWSDEDAVALPTDLKSISLVNATEIRKATALDPLKNGYCGTAVLRRNLEPVEYSVSFTIFTPERNLDIQCLNKEDFNLLYTNLKKYLSSMQY